MENDILESEVNESLGVKQELPEAPATAWTEYKRPDGFVVSFTLRSKDGKALLLAIDHLIETVKKQGSTPHERYPKNATKPPLDYVENRLCPIDGARLINSVTKQGKNLIKCENNKWDATLKKVVGCEFVEWEK